MISGNKVSIIILTHNLDLKYINIVLDSVNTTEEVSYELIVVDNGSHKVEMKNLLFERFLAGDISKLYLSSFNHFFSAGNNIGVKLSSPESSHVLLLNADVRIKNPLWLKEMLEVHEPGITACAICDLNGKLERVDGWCLLVDRNIYTAQHGMDEDFPFWGGITVLQRQILDAGFRVAGIQKYDSFIHHFGGKSPRLEAIQEKRRLGLGKFRHLFNDKKITIIPRL
jgi:GT2 family glycosyltransferase